jgi:hypothetical protein
MFGVNNFVYISTKSKHYVQQENDIEREPHLWRCSLPNGNYWIGRYVSPIRVY